MDYNTIPLKNYNLEKTLLGGQSFNWDLINDWYYGFFVDKVVKLKLENENLYWQTYPKNNDFEFLKNYLRLDTDYENLISKISKDNFIKLAIDANPNLRILKQEFDQTLLSYIVSINKNIPSIRKIIRAMCDLFGETLTADGITFKLFPKTEVLAKAELSELLLTKLGFRAKYIKATAGKLYTEGSNHNKDEEFVRNWLLTFNGVGPKVADAVLQYSLAFDNATPIDVWERRILVELYGFDPKTSYKEMRKWFREYFEGYAGWAGQFLFEYYRNLPKYL